MSYYDIHNLLGESQSNAILAIIISFFLFSSKLPKIFKTLYKFVIAYFVLKAIYIIIWSYNYKPPSKSKEFLNNLSKDAVVYIDDYRVIEPKFIINEIIESKWRFMSHGHSTPNKKVKEYTLKVIDRDKNITLGLKQDTQWNWEYSVFNSNLNEYLGTSRSIFNNPIKVIKNGKVEEKRF